MLTFKNIKNPISDGSLDAAAVTLSTVSVQCHSAFIMTSEAGSQCRPVSLHQWTTPYLVLSLSLQSRRTPVVSTEMTRFSKLLAWAYLNVRAAAEQIMKPVLISDSLEFEVCTFVCSHVQRGVCLCTLPFRSLGSVRHQGCIYFY